MNHQLIFACCLLLATSCEAATHTCSAVDKKATVYSSQTVTLTEDTSAKTCTFSVAGATSKEAPKDLRTNILGIDFAYRTQPGNFGESMQRLKSQGDGSIPNYVELLLAAGNESGKLPESALRKLNDGASRNALRSCATNFLDKPNGDSVAGSAGFVCSAYLDSDGRRVLRVQISDDRQRWTAIIPQPF